MYYSRYTTGKKGVMFGLSLLQLVTFEHEVVDIPGAQPKQSLPCLFHVLTTRHGIASVYPTPTRYVSASDHHHEYVLGFSRRIPSLFRHAMDASTDPHIPTCCLLAEWVHDIADHALKLISALKFPPSKDVPLSTLWAGYHVYYVAHLPKGKLIVDQQVPSLQLPGPPSSRSRHPISILALRFNSPWNLKTRFL
jgi:hypothetical protein